MVNRRYRTLEPITDALIEEVGARLAEGKPIRRTLPGHGRLHMDRPLPFLCIYRQPVLRTDAGTRELLLGEAAFLIVPAAPGIRRSMNALLETVARTMIARFDAFLMLEIWSTSDQEVQQAVEESLIHPTELRPAFTIAARESKATMSTVETLSRGLSRIRYLRQPASIEIDPTVNSHPPGLSPLLTQAQRRELGCKTIGLAVRPIYRDPQTGDTFPAVLRTLRRGVGRALKQAVFTFAQSRGISSFAHFQSFGRRTMVKAVREVDQRLSEIGDSFDFLHHVTPVNAEGAWKEFKRAKFEQIPRFYYPPLAMEPAILKRRLFDVPVERIEDPTLAHLFRQRQDELDRKITMIADVGTPRFLLGSLQVYGRPSSNLLNIASFLMDRISPRIREGSEGGQVDAKTFAEYARKEIDDYRRDYPAFTPGVSVREDIFSGLRCSGGALLIGRQTKIPSSRVEALLQHEVGTHLLTYYNGLAGPFQQLHLGLAGYDAMQEGLAVLSEYLVGGLSRPRIRLLAARVVATAQLIEGATFIETFRMLCDRFAFQQRVAYMIVLRTFRGGGLTKDHLYLKGLIDILEHLRSGGALEPLLVGKFAAEHIPLIQELQHRQVIQPPPLKPRYLNDPKALQRLREVRNGRTVYDLIEG